MATDAAICQAPELAVDDKSKNNFAIWFKALEGQNDPEVCCQVLRGVRAEPLGK